MGPASMESTAGLIILILQLLELVTHLLHMVMETATATFMPIMFSPTPGVPPPNPEWNGYQATIYPPPERILHPTPAYVMSSPSTETTVYTQNQPQMVVDEFPVRPGQPECSYFLKTGDCKFKSNCKYHHPKNRFAKPAPCALSDKGLPLRPVSFLLL
ncbi:hypothetical protein Goarm_015759 [Gossypium armourianum]|uniref:C3H1-type domain-containing protein n=1 Tax=Gossypium armourianum TaxID=34283 RepID=A0A7J9JA32_9ROSI|nr:hypothetical protein [Gossypium armourianum]